MNAANGSLSGPYAWGSTFLRNTKKIFLANFSAIDAPHIHTNPETGTAVIPIEIADVTVPVDSYEPNRFGLRNMKGNVAEMLGDIDQTAGGSWRNRGYDIRNESLMPFCEAYPLVGFRPIAILSKN